MPTFIDRAFDALDSFQGGLSSFSDVVRAQAADPPRLPQRELDRLVDLAERARAAAERLVTSFRIVQQTGVDIVDIQVRIQGESASLASALKAIGDTIERQHFVRETFAGALVDLDERAQLVAAAVFPSAVQGLRAVNVKLWEFDPLQWRRYTDTLTSAVQRGTLTADQEARIQEIAESVRLGFSRVNEFLNQLAEGDVPDEPTVRARRKQAEQLMKGAVTDAKRRMTNPYRMFRPMIASSGRIAEAVGRLLHQMRIPVFPPHESLGVLAGCMSLEAYEALTGPQRFALLNIAARMHATSVAGRPLLDAVYDIRINRVFPDRIYFDATAAIVDVVRQDDQFGVASAALHRFNEGSFKQRTFRRGNLQFSYASRGDDRVDVDADIDLYRDAIPHLFGEVLVNHLTGNVTNQFAVRRILDDHNVEPIGGFVIL
jgi:hypothetical protein